MKINNQSRFPLILHTILEDAKEQKFEHIISWVANSKNLFKIHAPKAFVSCIMKNYFKDQNHFKSFTRQLNLYGFQRISTGSHYDPIAPRGAYHHPLFVRGDIDLCLDMDRPKARNGRLFREKHSMKNRLRDNAEDEPIKSSWSKDVFLPRRVMRTTGPDNGTSCHVSFQEKQNGKKYCPQDKLEDPFKACSDEACLPLPVIMRTCPGPVSLATQRRLEAPSTILEDMADDIIYIFGRRIVALER